MSASPSLYAVLFLLHKEQGDQSAFYFARAFSAEQAIEVTVQEAQKQHLEGTFIPVCALTEQEISSIQSAFEQIKQHG